MCKEYKLLAARMTVTGGGVGDLTLDQAEAMLAQDNQSPNLYVGPEGPSEDTPGDAVNLWGE